MFEEGPGINAGDGTDLEELKDFVMSELLWDASLDPDTLIAEFLRGYYGPVAEKFIRLCVAYLSALTVPVSHAVSRPTHAQL